MVAGQTCFQQGDFYPRPPRGGRLRSSQSILTVAWISIHALREEGDYTHVYPYWRGGKFLSTPSARRATACPSTSTALCEDFYPRPPRGGRRRVDLRRPQMHPISIHALLAEGDVLPLVRSRACSNFYPRPPRGGRRRGCGGLPLLCIFLSTPSARRATTAVNENFDLVIDFYPRPPRGGRQTHPRISGSAGAISIHALREEGDAYVHNIKVI